MPRPDSGFLSGVLAGIQQFKQTRAFYQQMETGGLQQEAARAGLEQAEWQKQYRQTPQEAAQFQYDEALRRAGGTERLRRDIGAEYAPGEDERALARLEAELKLRQQYAPTREAGQIKPGDLAKLDEIMGGVITSLGFTEQNFPGIAGLTEDVHMKAIAQLTGGVFIEDGKLVQWPFTDQAGAITTIYTGLAESDPQIIAFAGRIATEEELKAGRLPDQVRNIIAGMAQRRLPIDKIRQEVQRVSFETMPAETTAVGEGAERLMAQPMTSLRSIIPFGKAIGGALLSDVPLIGGKASAIRDEGFRNLLAIHGGNVKESLNYLAKSSPTFGGMVSEIVQDFIRFLLRTGQLSEQAAAEIEGVPPANTESGR